MISNEAHSTELVVTSNPTRASGITVLLSSQLWSSLQNFLLSLTDIFPGEIFWTWRHLTWHSISVQGKKQGYSLTTCAQWTTYARLLAAVREMKEQRPDSRERRKSSLWISQKDRKFKNRHSEFNRVFDTVQGDFWICFRVKESYRAALTCDAVYFEVQMQVCVHNPPEKYFSAVSFNDTQGYSILWVYGWNPQAKPLK